MNNIQKFENFLESLKGNKHDKLIESIKEGYKLIFESEEDDEILDIMRKQNISWEEAKAKKDARDHEKNKSKPKIIRVDKPDMSNPHTRERLKDMTPFQQELFNMGISDSRVVDLEKSFEKLFLSLGNVDREGIKVIKEFGIAELIDMFAELNPGYRNLNLGTPDF